MHSLHFSTPLHDYLKNGKKAATKREITLLMAKTAVPLGEEASEQRPEPIGEQINKVVIKT
jgi:hypothetical protein